MRRVVAYQQQLTILLRQVLLLCLLCALSTVSWAQPDVAVLSQVENSLGKEGLLQQTTLYVWPVIDLRPLFELSPQSEPTSRSIEKYLVKGLVAYRNLKIIEPIQSLKYARSKRGYERILELARGFARRGVQSYREVELAQAQVQLESALELFEQAQQHSIDAAEVAQVHLTLGLIAVEQNQVLPAHLSFRESLLLNPRLRVRLEFDGPQVSKIFEQARAQLTNLPMDELVRLAERARKPQRRDPQPHQLRSWQTPQGLSTTLSIWKGEHLELKRDQVKGVDPYIISTLSARIWACLPIKREQILLERRFIRLDILYSMLSFIDAPVSFVPFQGFETSLSFNPLRSISVFLGGSWHISGRDTREDLRTDVSNYELYLGPQWRFGQNTNQSVTGAISLSASLTHHTKVSVSREVGCKYFDLKDQLPPQLCQPNQDITLFQASWALGPRIDALLNIPISKALSLHFRVSASTSVYQSEIRSFELPISAGLGVGYIFHLDAN